MDKRQYGDRLETARHAIESLFSRIREERDRLQTWGRDGYQAHADSARALFDTAYELGLEGVDDYAEVPKAAASLRAELGRIREELKEARRDAGRWQALVTSPRVSQLGGARFHQPGWLIAVEFYDEAPSGIAKAEAIQNLTDYADFPAPSNICWCPRGRPLKND